MRRILPLLPIVILAGCLVALAALRFSSTPGVNSLPAALPGLAARPAGSADAGARRTPLVQVVERVSPAVVNIAAESIVRQADPFFGGFFPPRQRRGQSLGSGFIIDRSGIVITNAHVVEGASRIAVSTLDGRELQAELIGSDHDADLAVLKVQGGNLPAVPLGSSQSLLIGEPVVAIGNPFGLSNSVTSGVLSARGRTVPAQNGDRLFTDFLQTDASINPGNSGGPLVNLAGEVIGINTAIISGSGIGFAIPADRARRVVDDLVRFGELRPLWTGLRLLTVDPELASRYGLATVRGAMVFKTYPGSPASQAGFAEGDVITSVQGQPVVSREEVATALYALPAGSPLRFQVRRGDRPLDVSLTPVQPPRDLGLRILEEEVGLSIAQRQRGLVVDRVESGSPADRTGLRPGDGVLGANSREVRTLDELGEEVLRGFDRGGLPLVVQRGPYAYNIEFPL